MARTVKVLVLMAGCYKIMQGAKIEFHLEKDVYVASSEGIAFGVAMALDGDEEELRRLGKEFGGTLIKNDPARRQCVVKVRIRKGGAHGKKQSGDGRLLLSHGGDPVRPECVRSVEGVPERAEPSAEQEDLVQKSPSYGGREAG